MQGVTCDKHITGDALCEPPLIYVAVANIAQNLCTAVQCTSSKAFAQDRSRVIYLVTTEACAVRYHGLRQ